MNPILNPLERNELEKAMLGRGVDYETIQLIIKDFDARTEHMYSLFKNNIALKNTCKKCEDWKYERLWIGYKFCPYCGRVLDI